jgi:hypothetical protein
MPAGYGHIRWAAVVTIQDLGSIGELVAAIATVATLGYLALGIRQNTESVRLSTELELSKLVVDFHARVTGQPELLRIWDAASDPSSLTPEDIRRFRWLAAEWFLIYDGQYDFYMKNHISEESWKPKIDACIGLLENPIIADWWEKRQAPLSGDFREYVESIRGLTDRSWDHQVIGSLSKEPT